MNSFSNASARVARSLPFRVDLPPTIALGSTVFAWLLMVAFDVALFSAQVIWRSSDIMPDEVIGFVYAFSIAGTITGAVALAAAGERHRAIGFALIGIGLLVASIPALHWLFLRLGASQPWSSVQRQWDVALGSLGPCLAVGAGVALVISGVVLALGVLARRMTTWQFRLLVVVAVIILGYWILPAVIYRGVLLTSYYLRGNAWVYRDALQGATIGAGAGAITGSVITGMMAHWLKALVRPARGPA